MHFSSASVVFWPTKKKADSEFSSCLAVESKSAIWLHPECSCIHNHTRTGRCYTLRDNEKPTTPPRGLFFPNNCRFGIHKGRSQSRGRFYLISLNILVMHFYHVQGVLNLISNFFFNLNFQTSTNFSKESHKKSKGCRNGSLIITISA